MSATQSVQAKSDGSLPVVAVGALGGTISMTTDDSGKGAVPTQNADSLVGSLARRYRIAVETRDISLIGSPSMTIRLLLQALDYAHDAVDRGAAGVVLTHGTDTLAESAYVLSLLWDRPEPLVLTGAMRPSDAPGADGPANLTCALRCAADPSMRGLGVLVCFADFVHSATLCEKVDSTAVSAFASPGWGPVARVDAESVVHVMSPAFHFDALPAPSADAPVRIPIITAALDDDGSLLSLLNADTCDAVVVAGVGSGRMSVRAAEQAKRLVQRGVPVVFVRKPSHGTTTTACYAYPGSESDLIAGGLLPGGLLSAEKTRLLLHVLLQAGYRGEALAAELRRRCLA
ncbi:L-asparaginase [Bifidobacterium goeldii]|uniref:L-asparaginase n=1 Tax=Bifidobacterium goeldii TaxID=2306975 RepID=A0A430FH19_9BIFI|nr:asparaginase [Bifidobacterium goeldii]RSX52174.1 L-asparaginase [Bifidobacterium goeldii]